MAAVGRGARRRSATRRERAFFREISMRGSLRHVLSPGRDPSAAPVAGSPSTTPALVLGDSD